jgi:hypothetical protein
VRIAKPLLLVTTPVGVVFGIHEAWKVGAWRGTLMIVLISVVAGFFWITLRRIREDASNAAANAARDPHS